MSLNHFFSLSVWVYARSSRNFRIEYMTWAEKIHPLLFLSSRGYSNSGGCGRDEKISACFAHHIRTDHQYYPHTDHPCATELFFPKNTQDIQCLGYFFKHLGERNCIVIQFWFASTESIAIMFDWKGQASLIHLCFYIFIQTNKYCRYMLQTSGCNIN